MHNFVLFDPSGTTTLGQSGSGSNRNEGVLRIPQSSSITEASSLDCLVSYPGHSSVKVLPLCRETVDTFYSPSRLCKRYWGIIWFIWPINEYLLISPGHSYILFFMSSNFYWMARTQFLYLTGLLLFLFVFTVHLLTGSLSQGGMQRWCHILVSINIRCSRNERPDYDLKPSDGEAPVLKLREIRSVPSMPLIPSPLVPVRVSSIGQI